MSNVLHYIRMATCHVVAESLEVLLPTVTGQAENVPNELDDLAKEVSRQGGKSATWLLFFSSP